MGGENPDARYEAIIRNMVEANSTEAEWEKIRGPGVVGVQAC